MFLCKDVIVSETLRTVATARSKSVLGTFVDALEFASFVTRGQPSVVAIAQDISRSMSPYPSILALTCYVEMGADYATMVESNVL